MIREIILRRRAEDDVRTLLRWYETRDRALGDRFLIELRHTLEQIGQFPESGPLLHGKVRRAVVPTFPYFVFDLVEAARVVVLAVLHTSRNPAVWPRK